MNYPRVFLRIISVFLSAVMICGMLPAFFDALPAAAKTVETTETVYEKYIPNKTGQAIEAGRYIIYNHSRSCVLAGKTAANGGVTASADFTISNDKIVAPGADVVSIIPVPDTTNHYYIRTSEGKYLSIAAATSQSAASLVDGSSGNLPRVAATVNSTTDYVALSETGLRFFLNAYSQSVFGTYWYGISNNENQLTLYRETEITTQAQLPDFPEPGSTRLEKRATGISFSETGVAKVELDVTAVPPFYSSGVDVLFITDVSNSMAWVAGQFDTAPGIGQTTKMQDMQAAVCTFANAVMESNSGTGMVGNNTVSFVTFGGWDRDRNGASYNYIDPTQTLFVAESDLSAVKNKVNAMDIRKNGSYYTLTLNGQSGAGYGGTNYDYGFMEGYQAVAKIKQAYKNETGTEYDDSARQIFVIFVSDGAPTCFNGLMCKPAGSGVPYATAYYSDTDATGGTTTAYKNNTTRTYTLDEWYSHIRNNASVWATRLFNLPKVAGMDTLGIDFANGGFSGMQFLASEGHPLDEVLSSLVSGETLSVLTADDPYALARNLAEEASTVASMASYVVATDKLGAQYSLQMASYIINPLDGSRVPLSAYSVRPSIIVAKYPTIHASSVGSNGISQTDIGTVTGEPEVLETVTFNDEGTEAYSDLIGGGSANILIDGVIRAETFYYNTRAEEVTVDGYTIPAESFYWNIGKFSEDKLTLSYYVNLDGSADRSVPDGIYETNEYATLTYKTYQGAYVTEEYEKPELPWENRSLITVTKKWTDGTDHAPVTAKVIYEDADGTVTDVSGVFVLSADNGWSAEVEADLTGLSAGGIFRVTDTVDGYYSCSGDLGIRMIVVNGQIVKTNHFEINLYNTPVTTTCLEVTKDWCDGYLDDHADDPIEVELYCNNTPTGRTAVLNSANRWTYTFSDLPLMVDGAVASYHARELTAFDDYVSVPGPVENINASQVPGNAVIIDDGSATGIVIYEDGQGYAHAMSPEYAQTIRNETDTGVLRLKINKKWDDNGIHDPVTVSVGCRYADGTEQTIRSGITLSADNDWSEYISVPFAEEQVTYFITEDTLPDGYTSLIGEFVFSNENAAEVSIYNIAKAQTAFTARKAWADGAENHSTEAVEVELLMNGSATGKTATLEEANNWTYTFGGLDLVDADGNDCQYSIRENTATMIYTVSYSAVDIAAGIVTAPGYTLVYNGGTTGISVYEDGAGNVLAAAPSFSQTVTNTPKIDVNKVALIVNKEWVDNLSSHDAVGCVVGYEAADGTVTQVSAGFTLSSDSGWSQEVEVAACDTTSGRYVLLEPTVNGYEPITGGLTLVDSTETIYYYVPVTNFEEGGEYVVMTLYNNRYYALGANYSADVIRAKAVGAELVTGNTITVGNQSYDRYLTAPPVGNTVWTYTGQGYLRNSALGSDLTANMENTNRNLFLSQTGSVLTAVTESVWSAEQHQKINVQFLKVDAFWTYGTRAAYLYYSGSGQFFAEQDWHYTDTRFLLFKKVAVTVGSSAESITATNLPKLGNQVVVIDYGLPVQVSLSDYYETLGISPSFVGIGKPTENSFKATQTQPTGYDLAEVVYPHGTVSYSDGKLTYTPSDMRMSSKDVIHLAFSLEVKDKTCYLYGSVTVVPATIIYYEESFVSFTDTTRNRWEVVSGSNDGFYQAEDRPGADVVTADMDADNVYGYDGAYVNCTTYSNGKAYKVNVKNGDYALNGGKWPTAEFTFTGTAFDLVSVTSNKTGFIYIDIYRGTEASGEKYKRWVVDTYYGYERSRNGYIRHEWYWNGQWYVRNTIVPEMTEIPDDQKLPANIAQADTGKTYVTYEINYTWTPSQNGNEALYQIPVIKSPALAYGTYTVVVTPSYSTFFDHTSPTNPETGRKDYTDGNYDFYFDAVRVYAPATDYESYNREYYTLDREGWPQFIELRNNLISAARAIKDGSSINGAVFFDAVNPAEGEGSDLTDFLNYGPDNEVYLSPGQSISFALLCEKNGKAIDTVQIGAKKLIGGTVRLTARTTAGSTKLIEIISSSDMYYIVGEDLNWKDNVSEVITLTNTGEASVSLTNIKITFKDSVRSGASFAPMSRKMLKLAVSLSKETYITSVSECCHRYDFSVTSVPTAANPGVVMAVCGDCGDEYRITIPPLSDEHYGISAMQKATEQTDGWVEYVWETDDAAVTFRVAVPAVVSPTTEQDDTEKEDLTHGDSFYGMDVFSKLTAFFKALISYLKQLFSLL